jgi:tRNA-splicing ligase RtcB
MGSRSYIARGLGNPESFESCFPWSGGGCREAPQNRSFTLEDLKKQTAGVECRRMAGYWMKIPGALHKDIDAVMAAQQSLVVPSSR